MLITTAAIIITSIGVQITFDHLKQFNRKSFQFSLSYYSLRCVKSMKIPVHCKVQVKMSVDLSEEDFVRRRTRQGEALETLVEILDSSSFPGTSGSSSTITVILTGALRTVLKICIRIRAGLGTASAGQNENGEGNNDNLSRIASCWDIIQAQTNGIVDTARNGMMEAAMSLNRTEQGVLANYMKQAADVFSAFAEIVNFVLKILSRGISWAYKRVTESFLEFVEHLEAILALYDNEKQSITM